MCDASATSEREKGFALITSVIVLLLLTGVVTAFIANVRTESLISGNDVDYTSAFYAAEAGLEKQNADLSKLFQATIFPTAAQITAIESAGNQPVFPNVTYTEYNLEGGQSTVLNGAINAAVTTATVDSTVGWPDTGYFMIGAEEMNYTGARRRRSRD